MEVTSFVSTLASTPNLPTQPKQHFKAQPAVPHLTELWIMSSLTQLQLTWLVLYLHSTLLASSICASLLHIDRTKFQGICLKGTLSCTPTHHQLSGLT